MSILDIIGAVLSGGATGLVGIGLQSLFGWLNKREDHKHALEMKAEDRKYLALEGENAVRLQAVKSEGESDVAESNAFAASFKMDPKRYATGERPEGLFGTIGWFLLVLLDVTRGAVRPGLTLYLSWIATRLYWESQATIAKIDPNKAIQTMANLHSQIVLTLLYLFSTCVTWWFGTRVKHLPGTASAVKQ